MGRPAEVFYVGFGILLIPVVIAVVILDIYGEYDRGTFFAPCIVQPMLYWAAHRFRLMSVVIWLFGLGVILFGVVRHLRSARVVPNRQRQ